MIFFEEIFTNNSDSRWTNVVSNGGPITVTDERKYIQGTGIFAGSLGFFGLVLATGISLTNKIFQADFFFDPSTTQSIGLVTVAHFGDLGDVNARPGVHFNYNSFPTPRIQLFDEGSVVVPGSFNLPEVNANKRYTAKFHFNAPGTISAYLSALPEVANFFMGTTANANDFFIGPLYFAFQQTFINPSDKRVVVDNIYIHDEGLSFVVPENRPREVL